MCMVTIKIIIAENGLNGHFQNINSNRIFRSFRLEKAALTDIGG